MSLQYDECSAELAAARSRFGRALHAFPEVDLFNDLDEAAALTRACDLVISAPTAVSVLAAAVGVPTWQMTYGPDWQTHGTRTQSLAACDDALRAALGRRAGRSDRGRRAGAARNG